MKFIDTVKEFGPNKNMIGPIMMASEDMIMKKRILCISQTVKILLLMSITSVLAHPTSTIFQGLSTRKQVKMIGLKTDD